MTTGLAELTDLDSYLQRFGPTLAARTLKDFEPLHDPARDPAPPELVTLRKPLYPAQAAAVGGLVKVLDRGRSGLLLAEIGTGKGGLPSSKVLTPTGWTTLGEIREGDQILNPAGGTAKVVGIFRRGRMPMFRVVFDDGAETVCSADHLWVVNSATRKFRGKPPQTLELREIIAGGLRKKNGGHKHYIPLVDELAFPEAELPINPYLLGYLLGNGNFSNPHAVGVSIPDGETIGRIDRILEAILPDGVQLKRTQNPIDYRISNDRGEGNPLLATVQALGLAGARSEDKFIPPLYLRASQWQRMLLLQGLMDSDGSPSTSGVDYSTASPQLSRDATELVRSLGGVATTTTRVPTYTHEGERRTGQLSYRSFFSLPSSVPPFRLTRKAYRLVPRSKYEPTRAISRVEPIGDEECICIRVDSDNQLYITDDYIVTHNTVMSLAAVHAHARGRPYRALVMCPDHLIAKWARHVEAFIPEAVVRGYDRIKGKPWRWDDWVRLADERPGAPTAPEWFILGRDASKFDPAWEPGAVPRRQTETVGSRMFWLGPKEADPTPEAGVKLTMLKREKDGYRQYWRRSYRTSTVWTCPRCGAVIAEKDGTPRDFDWLARGKRTCVAPAVPPAGGWPTEPGFEVPKCGEPLWRFVGRRRSKPGPIDDWPAEDGFYRGLADRAWARWQARRTAADRSERKQLPWRWAPARTIERRLKGFFGYFIVDEVHETKSEEAAQAVAAGKLVAACGKTLALTGTLMGGYAWHLFPTLFRLAPEPLLAGGFAWGDLMKFSERYGRVEERVEYDGKPRPVDHLSHSMGRTGGTHTKRVRPGIVPTVFGDHLLERTVFLELEQISDSLPPRPAEEVIAVAMDPDQLSYYVQLEIEVRKAIAPMIVRGDTSLLGRMLHGLLGYPDHPFGYKADRYFAPFGISDPGELDPARSFPKERALVELCRAEAERGNQVWVYVQMTGVRDVRPRLVERLEAAGLTADILDREVDRRARERWITERGPRLNVAISHPMLVQTGLELFDPVPGGSNFNTIVFYQTGYNPFTLLQAGGRAWRIGQPKPCRTVYLYYQGTMQQRAVELMGAKLAAARALAGRFSAEGLAALCEDASLELALARSLVEQVRAARPVNPATVSCFGATPAPAPAPAPPPVVAPAPRPLILTPAPSPAPASRSGGRRRPDAPGQLAFPWTAD